MNLLARFGVYARGLAYLRAISNSLKTLAANDDERMRREFGRRPAPRHKVTIDTLDLTESERRWERQLERNYEDD